MKLVYRCIICVQLNYFEIYYFVQMIRNKGIAQSFVYMIVLKILNAN